MYSGQPGVTIGPTGLDPKRLKPGKTGLFFPAWELHEQCELVKARKFHDIAEARPAGWKLMRNN